MPKVLHEIHLAGRVPLHRGKVRSLYDLGDALLMVASDRLSAFDVVFPTAIPHKGRVLTALSVYWFQELRDLAPGHFLREPSAAELSDLGDAEGALLGRSLIVRKCTPLPIECVVRGTLEGSAAREYASLGTVGGFSMPTGLHLHDRLPEPLFTPTTKAAVGHDQPISFPEVEELIGTIMATRVRDLSIRLFLFARDILAENGIILADTKFEFGLSADGELLLIDEVLTPDSSRFLLLDDQGNCIAMDKQFVREWCERSGWDKRPPAPPLPPEIVAATSARYREIARRITGKDVTA